MNRPPAARTPPGADGTSARQADSDLGALGAAAEDGRALGRAFLRTTLRPLFRSHRGTLLLALALNGLCGAAVAVQTLTPKWLIDDILAAPGLTDRERWTRFAWLAGAFLLTTIVLRMFAWHGGYRIFTWVREQVVLHLRALFFRHVNHLCLRFHADHPSGELFSYLFGSPLASMVALYQHVANGGPGSVMVIATTLATAATWDPVLGLVLLASSGSSVLLMHVARKRIGVLQRDYQQAEGEVSGVVGDLLRGSRAVKLHAMEDQVAEDFTAQAETIRLKSYRRDVDTHVESMKQEGWGYAAFTLLMGAVLWRHLAGRVSLGEATAVLMAFSLLQGPLNFFFQTAVLAGAAQAGAERLARVLTASSTTPDPPAGDPSTPVPPAGDLCFTGVSFSYVPGTPVLTDLTLRIPYGQRLAFVGPSGAGKSTVSQLLLRLYDPDQGRVSLAGVDLRRLRGADLRRRFGVVPQDPFIFRTSIRDNVTVARPEADDDQIIRALALANAWEFVAALPQGLETRVGEGGASLSGGQRQRLAIARALLADTPFFILDEATSALDTLSEELIQRTLDTHLAGRTAIIIAHRLATVRHCHRIVVLDRGMLVQDGAFAELMDRPGLFQELVRGQRLRA